MTSERRSLSSTVASWEAGWKALESPFETCAELCVCEGAANEYERTCRHFRGWIGSRLRIFRRQIRDAGCVDVTLDDGQFGTI